MNVEEILGQEKPQTKSSPGSLASSRDDYDKKDKLSALISSGKSKDYLGKQFTLADVEAFSQEDVERHFNRYQAKLGGVMTKTIGNSLINLYILGLSRFFDVDDEARLFDELSDDPFIDQALAVVCCDLYYKYGVYLAPLTAALTSAKHINFSTVNKNGNDYDSHEEPQTSGSGEEGSGSQEVKKDPSEEC